MKGERVISPTFSEGHASHETGYSVCITMIAQAPNTNWSELLTSALWPKSDSRIVTINGFECLCAM